MNRYLYRYRISYIIYIYTVYIMYDMYIHTYIYMMHICSMYVVDNCTPVAWAGCISQHLSG